MATDQDVYDQMEIPALTNILLNPASAAEIHKRALSALSRLDPLNRTSSLITVLQSISKHPSLYDQDICLQVVDLLATDPDADATVAMLEVLPRVVETAIRKGDTKQEHYITSRGDIILGTEEQELSPEFREYFFQALLTRQREEDLQVWAEMLPGFSGQTLSAIFA